MFANPMQNTLNTQRRYNAKDLWNEPRSNYQPQRYFKLLLQLNVT